MHCSASLNVSFARRGSWLMTGRPRFTHDADLVVEITNEKVAELSDCWPPILMHPSSSSKTPSASAVRWSLSPR